MGILILSFTGYSTCDSGPQAAYPIDRHRVSGTVNMCGITGPTLNLPYGGMEQEKMIPTSPPAPSCPGWET